MRSCSTAALPAAANGGAVDSRSCNRSPCLTLPSRANSRARADEASADSGIFSSVAFRSVQRAIPLGSKFSCSACSRRRAVTRRKTCPNKPSTLAKMSAGNISGRPWHIGNQSTQYSQAFLRLVQTVHSMRRCARRFVRRRRCYPPRRR